MGLGAGLKSSIRNLTCCRGSTWPGRAPRSTGQRKALYHVRAHHRHDGPPIRLRFEPILGISVYASAKAPVISLRRADSGGYPDLGEPAADRWNETRRALCANGSGRPADDRLCHRPQTLECGLFCGSRLVISYKQLKINIDYFIYGGEEGIRTLDTALDRITV